VGVTLAKDTGTGTIINATDSAPRPGAGLEHEREDERLVFHAS